MNKWRILLGSIVIILSFFFVSAVYADTNYTVQYGDTLWRIAWAYGTTPQAIAASNPKITDINLIYAGDLLVIPPGSGTGGQGQGYVIQYGDTLFRIALRNNTTVAAIQGLNPQITNPNLIYAGQTLALPAATTPGSTGGIPQPIPESGIYIVQTGDGLTGIGRRYGISVDVLLQLNPEITNPNLILVGQQIKLR